MTVHLAFVLLAPAALAVVVAAAILAYRKLHGTLRYAFLTLSATQAVWVLASAMQVLAATPEMILGLTELMYGAGCATVPTWLWFALLYTGRLSRRTRTALALFAAVSLLFYALVLTNPAHGLVWTSISFRPSGPFQTLFVGVGPALTFYMALALIVLGWSVLLIVRSNAASGRVRRRLGWAMAAGVGLAVLHDAAMLAGWAEQTKDFFPLSLAACSAAVGLSLRSNHLPDLRPLARTALVERMREGLLVLDAQSRVADVNPAVRAMLGHPDPLLGLHIGEVLRPEQRAAVENLWGAEDAQAEVPFVLGGEQRYYDLRISPVRGPDGERAGRVILVYDITELHTQQEALRQANVHLQTQNAALDDFAHTVAHDLKTSIQHLVGHAELLHEDGPRLSEREHRDLASGLVRAGIKLDSIVQELLLFATTRRGAVQPVPLDMGAVFEEAMVRLRPMLDATGAHVTVTTDWPDVLGYAAWIETVWYNYLSNAAKYGGRTAPILVCADPVGPDGQVRFWVQDHGPGLSAPDREQLFLPFSRVPGTESDAEGHGLGLAIVQRIMERLGGRCGVESAGVDGEGSRFWFSLPAVPRHEPEALVPSG